MLVPSFLGIAFDILCILLELFCFAVENRDSAIQQ